MMETMEAKLAAWKAAYDHLNVAQTKLNALLSASASTSASNLAEEKALREEIAQCKGRCDALMHELESMLAPGGAPRPEATALPVRATG